jgi:hypothetical protein
MIRSLLSLFVAIILFTNSFANNYGTPGTGVRWTMDDLVNNAGGDVSFSGGAYLVNDTVFIRENDTLSITTDIIVKFAANTYFDINGVLIINPPTGVTFTAQNTASRYLGMRIDSSNSTVIRKLTFEYANALRLFDCSPLIENCIFRLNTPATTFGNAAISLFRSNAVITNCQFIDNQRAAIQGGANIPNAPKITGCLFQGNNTLNQNVPQINLGTSGTDTVKIINNQLLRASTNSGGIGFLPIGNVFAIIKHNVIKNNRYGMTFNGGANINVLVSYNRIDSNNTQGDPNLGGSGIAFAGGSATSQQNSIVTGNIFTANLWGITIQNRSRPNLGNITNADTSDDGKNHFINNTNTGTPGIDLYNNSVDPIFAQNNYWNTNDPAVIESKIVHTPDIGTLGLVNYSGYIVLPVEFLAFTGVASGRNALLNWQTIYETNSAYFIIQRSTNGTDFDSIGRVNGSGTTFAAHDYSFTDASVPYFNRPIYYRLKLVNTNGSFKESGIVSVTVSVSNNGELVRLYPTVIPASSQLTAEITSDKDQLVTFQFFDGNGRKLAQFTRQVIAATNRFSISAGTLLPAGWLYVRVTGQGIDKTIPVLQL